MIVTFICQCDKKAIKRTRQVLDAFANRIGDFAWQTVISEEGLAMVKKLLARTASKSTAVSCYRFHTKKHSELLWIVGNRNKFNELGFVPVNTTKRNILHSEWQNDWQYISAIAIIATLAALLHDLGKSTQGFQHKLKNNQTTADPYRHEWLSLKIFLWLITDCSSDKAWLERFVQIDTWLSTQSVQSLNQFLLHDDLALGNLHTLPPLAQWVAWLVISHHRLPPLREVFLSQKQREDSLYPPKEKFLSAIARLERPLAKVYGEIHAKDNWVKNPHVFDQLPKKKLIEFWQLDDCVINSPLWQKTLKRWAKKALSDTQLSVLMAQNTPIDNEILLYLSRLCLMIGDHNYSGLKDDDKRRVATTPSMLLANTDRKTRKARQFLDEHLVGVAKFTAHFAHHLPIIAERLPTLSHHRHLTKNTANPRFAWQNHAYKLAKNLQQDSDTHGFFGVNMASTGCGKTIGNARIMYGLSDEKHGARFSVALGLRVLTLQTGLSLKQDLHLDDEQLAILVGGGVRQLFDINQKSLQDTLEQATSISLAGVFGSESADELVDGLVDGRLDYHALDGLNIDSLLHDPKAKKLLFSPIVSCTIDHLIQACECKRGGGYIAPMLRLLSGDLILDEPDDFDHHDLPALMRLVHLAGLFGAKVLLSSATLQPDLVIGLFESYMAGRQIYNQSQNKPMPKVICAWFDEQKSNISHQSCTDKNTFETHHHAFVAKRTKFLNKEAIRRQAEILAVDLAYHSEKPNEFYQQLGQIILDGAKTLHNRHHITHQDTQHCLSVGLVRIANIKELVNIATALQKTRVDSDTQIHVACYHARQLLVLRNRLENTLDRLLKRNLDNEQAIFDHPEIYHAIRQNQARHHIFVVLATPVAEVGRDHDYDWAIVEPSSMRSIIQLAGRVWRHRPNKAINQPNLLILQYNIRYLKNRLEKLVFTKPGFEIKQYHLKQKDVRELIDDKFLQKIDACPRIRQTILRQPPESLAELEHGVTKALFNQDKTNAINAYWRAVGASNRIHTHLQQLTPFRHNPIAEQTWVLLPKQPVGETGFDVYALDEINKHGIDRANTHNHYISVMDFAYQHPQINTWLTYDVYDELVSLQTHFLDKSLLSLAIQFSQVSLEQDQSHWYFSPFFGVVVSIGE